MAMLGNFTGKFLYFRYNISSVNCASSFITTEHFKRHTPFALRTVDSAR